MIDIPLTVTKVSATDDLISWQPVAGVGSYRLMRDGKWVSSTYDGAKTSWRVKRGQTYLVRAYGGVIAEGVYPAPPGPAKPVPPTLTNPVTFTCQSGVANFFDAAGRDAIIKNPGLIEQGPPTGNRVDNAIVTIKNSPNVIAEPLAIHADHLQGPGIGNAYGYGLYVIGCGTAYLEQYEPSGPGMSQGLVISGGTKKVQVIGPAKWSIMHPVWHLANGKPAEVHTDAIQSYGGPGVLDLYDLDIETCGSVTQVQPYKYAPAGFTMGRWTWRDVIGRQKQNPLSDEGAHCFTKDPSGGAFWPTEYVRCTVDAIWTPFSVSWVSDTQAWQPGGTWKNLGEPWAVI